MSYILFIGIAFAFATYLYLKLRSVEGRIDNVEYLAIGHSHYLEERVRASESPKEGLIDLESSYEYALRLVVPKYGKMKREQARKELLDLLGKRSKISGRSSDP